MPLYRHIKPPPELFLREFHEEEPGIEPITVKEYFDLERYRWGKLKDWLNELYIGIPYEAEACSCHTCFRWVWTTTATTNGQTDFYPPLPMCELEDSIYNIVYARRSFMYYGTDYTVDTLVNCIVLNVGIPAGAAVTIYAMWHDDIQEVYYEPCTVPSAPGVPYAFSPPVTVDSAGGRQLVFARSSPRFLDSGRDGDEYTVSNVVNTISFTAGLGPAGEMAAIHRLRICGVKWHEEILADYDGQTVFQPQNIGNVVKPHDIGKMIVYQRNSFLHPGVHFTTDVLGNLIEIQAPGLAMMDDEYGYEIGQPLNVWVFC